MGENVEILKVQKDAKVTGFTYIILVYASLQLIGVANEAPFYETLIIM